MVELARQVLRHHVLVNGGAAVKAQTALAQVGDELLSRHIFGVGAQAEITQQLAVHRHTSGLQIRPAMN